MLILCGELGENDMIKKCTKFTDMLSIKNKLILSYTITFSVFMMVLLIFVYMLFFQAMKKNAVTSAQEYNKQIEKNISTIISDIILLTEVPIMNEEILDILQNEIDPSDENYELLCIKNNERMNDLFYKNIFYMNKLIMSVIMYNANRDLIYFKSTQTTENNNISQSINQSEWYQKIVGGKGYPVVIGRHNIHGNQGTNEDVITIGRNIINPDDTSEEFGVIAINISIKNILTLWDDFSVYQNGWTAIIDENGNIITNEENNINKTNEIISKINSAEDDNLNSFVIDGEKYSAVLKETKFANWKIISVILHDELLASIYHVGKLCFLAILVLFPCIIFISVRIATSITRPIKELKQTMYAIQGGEMHMRAYEDKSEIGELGNSFNLMLDQIDSLIEKIYHEEKEKRVTELIALQAQVSPHFIYNTLTSIKCMAQMQGASGIVNSLDALIKLLIFTSKNVQQVVKLKDEIELTNNYIHILNTRYINRIKFILDIDENLLNHYTPKFILQPIIENSILHGFDGQKAKSVIFIKIFRVNEFIVFEIVDNGTGMDQEQIQKILTQNTTQDSKAFNKIGVYNVNRRIKMICGNQFGVSITSKMGYYTKTKITIPLMNNELNEY